MVRALQFLYPYGATISAMKPAVAVLSTGSVSFPLNRPVCAMYSHKVHTHIRHMVTLVHGTNIECLSRFSLW